MHEFKLEHFRRDHPGESFPEFQHLTEAECAALTSEVIKRFRLSELRMPSQLVPALWDSARVLEGVDAEETSFSVIRALTAAGAMPTDRVCINWLRDWDTIDRFRLADLDRFFEDIWYPSSDDLEVIAETLDWILLIDHEGVVCLALP